MLTARTFLIYFLGAWAAAAITIAVLEGQPDSPLKRIHDPMGNSKLVPNPSGFRIPASDDPYTIVSRSQLLGFQYVRGMAGFSQIVVPWWFLYLCISLLPAYWLWSMGRKFRSMLRARRAGYCRVCGYDLRASAHRCPECGTLIEELEPLPAFEMT
jgi:hypothetical protein